VLGFGGHVCWQKMNMRAANSIDLIEASLSGITVSNPSLGFSFPKLLA